MPVKVQPRRQWNENQHLVKAREVFENYNIRLFDTFEAYMKHMASLRKEKDSYGLIHGDYLLSNYFSIKIKLPFLYFDECEYSWFISDIAVCMLYYLIGGDPSGLMAGQNMQRIGFSLIMQGYLTEIYLTSAN